MDLARQQKALKDAHEGAKIQFIVTELDLALTYCEMAESADDEGAASRLKAHARKAYETAIRFLASAILGPDIRLEVSEKIERLKSLRADSGEAPNAVRERRKFIAPGQSEELP